jgi:hypothetical protein
MPGLKLFDYETAYVQLEENGKKYILKEYDAKLAKEVAVYDEKAMKGERSAMEMQMHLLTGIPTEELKKLAQWKLNEISKYCVQMNVERKKKEKKPKKSN